MKEKRSPYHVIKSRYVTEKTTMLENLQHAKSNRCLSRCDKPKYAFLVDKKANRIEIARAFEMIYADKGVKVRGVNTINVKPKKRRVRGRSGFRSAFKKAIITLESGDSIDELI